MPRYLPVCAELDAQGYIFPYEWSRKPVKNFNLRVRTDGSVTLSTPTWITREQAEAFLLDHLDFIKKAKDKTATHHPEKACLLAEGDALPIFGKTYTVCLLKSKKYAAYTENGVLYLVLPDSADARARVNLFLRFAASEVEREMRALTAHFAPYFLTDGAPMPQITLRRMKSRWGACFYKENRVSYSTNLIFMPRECLAYVACHELAHFRYPNHSPEFYAWLSRALPNHKELRKQLHTLPVPRVGEE